MRMFTMIPTNMFHRGHQGPALLNMYGLLKFEWGTPQPPPLGGISHRSWNLGELVIVDERLGIRSSMGTGPSRAEILERV